MDEALVRNADAIVSMIQEHSAAASRAPENLSDPESETEDAPNGSAADA